MQSSQVNATHNNNEHVIRKKMLFKKENKMEKIICDTTKQNIQ